MKSSLITAERISPNKNSPRNHKIDRLTIHCFVGQVTAEQGLAAFASPSRKASCNYVVGCDGSIGLCVDEADRSWCSSNRDNDNRAITIEVASNTKHPYAVTDKAMDSLLDLIEDICRRNGKRLLLWFGDKKDALAYEPLDHEIVMTVHRWFAAKECPGQYLLDMHPVIAAEINERLNGDREEPETVSETYTVKKGDTLWGLSRKWGVSVEDIINANKSKYPRIRSILCVGWELNTPGKAYTVKRGDTLWSLARRWGVSVNDIINANKNEYPGIGDVLGAGWAITKP